MKTLSQIEKIKIVHKRNIDNFIKVHGIAYPEARKVKKKWIIPKKGSRQGNTIFMTSTFEKGIYSKVEAEKKFKSFLKDLRVYTPFQYCCVPEKHDSGAYHYHLLISPDEKDMTINILKERIRRLRFIGYVDVQWTWGPLENVTWYLTQYLNANNLNALEGRSISYSKGVQRVANSRFALWSPVAWGWREKWKNMNIFIPKAMNCRESVVKEYYDKIVCRPGCSDRMELIELSKKSDMEEMYAYVMRGIREYILISPPLHRSDQLHSLFLMESICTDSLLDEIPF